MAIKIRKNLAVMYITAKIKYYLFQDASVLGWRIDPDPDRFLEKAGCQVQSH